MKIVSFTISGALGKWKGFVCFIIRLDVPVGA